MKLLGNDRMDPTVRRALLGADGKAAGAADATVVGWMPPEVADFLDDRGRPAALWRVRYLAGSALAGDNEDLELHEVLEAAAALSVK